MEGKINEYISGALAQLLHYTDLLVASANLTITTFCSLLGAVCIYLYRVTPFAKSSPLPQAILGLAVFAFGWAIHRSYWGFWRTVRLMEWDSWDKWLIANGYLALLPSAAILVGLAMMLGPLWTLVRSKEITTREDYFLGVALIFSVYWFAAVSLFSLDSKEKDSLQVRKLSATQVTGIACNLRDNVLTVKLPSGKTNIKLPERKQ